MGLLQTRYWPQHGYGLRLGNQVETNLLDALMFQVQHSSRFVRQVNNPAVDNRAAIINAHHHRPAISQIGDLYVGPQRQRGMGRGQVVHVESFATGGFLAVEIASVPGRRPNLVRTTSASLLASTWWLVSADFEPDYLGRGPSPSCPEPLPGRRRTKTPPVHEQCVFAFSSPRVQKVRSLRRSFTILAKG